MDGRVRDKKHGRSLEGNSMSKKLIPLVIGGVLLTVGAKPALAEFQINGFASFGGNVTDAPHRTATGINKNPLTGSYQFQPLNKDQEVTIQKMGARPTFDPDTSLGLQIAKNLTKDVSFMSQFVATGTSGDYQVETSWLFAKYQINNEWAGRVGRFRAPAYMLSDYLDVRYAYPWVRPPMEVYAQVPFSNITGVDLNFNGTVWGHDLVVQGFYGSGNPNITLQGQEVNLSVRDLKGISASYGNEIFTGRVIYANNKISFNPQPNSVTSFRDFLIQAQGCPAATNGATGPCTPAQYTAGLAAVNAKIPSSFWEADNTFGSFQGIGYKFDWHNIYSLGEMVQRRITGLQANLLGSYVLLGYRFGEIMPHLTFAKIKTTDNKVRRLMSNWGLPSSGSSTIDNIMENSLGSIGIDQSSWTAGLRYDAFAGTAFKAEWQLIKPENNKPGFFSTDPLRRVNVFSLAMDIVF